jgi:predicted nucleotidyltransferase
MRDYILENDVNTTDVIMRIVLEHYPTTQAIYLFGMYSTADEWPDSDVDIAILLPPEQARRRPQLMLTPCHYALADALGKPVDLLNAREVSTVLQKEIVKSGRRLYCTDDDAAAEFEMLTLSHYQKLNEERKAILEAFRETGRAYAV